MKDWPDLSGNDSPCPSCESLRDEIRTLQARASDTTVAIDLVYGGGSAEPNDVRVRGLGNQIDRLTATVAAVKLTLDDLGAPAFTEAGGDLAIRVRALAQERVRVQAEAVTLHHRIGEWVARCDEMRAAVDRLTRERDELRVDRDEWRTQHENMLELFRAEEAKRIAAERERDSAREALASAGEPPCVTTPLEECRHVAELRKEADKIDAQRAAAVIAFGRVSDMLINAGLPGGDSNVQLANLRKLIEERDRLKAELAEAKRDLASHDCKAMETGDLCGGCCACVAKQDAYAMQLEEDKREARKEAEELFGRDDSDEVKRLTRERDEARADVDRVSAGLVGQLDALHDARAQTAAMRVALEAWSAYHADSMTLYPGPLLSEETAQAVKRGDELLDHAVAATKAALAPDAGKKFAERTESLQRERDWLSVQVKTMTAGVHAALAYIDPANPASGRVIEALRGALANSVATAEAPGHVQGCNGRGCSGECHREVGLQGPHSPDRVAALEAVAEAARAWRKAGYYSVGPARQLAESLAALDRRDAPGKDGGSNG